MKKHGVLNSHLSRVIAGLGHSDYLVVCDAGLPIPHGGEVVDLALTRNIPRFLDVVNAILEEMQVERAVIAEEMEDVNRSTHNELLRMLAGTEISKVAHEEFKRLTRENGNTTFVRTGEVTAFANVILVSGVNFD
ncbi:MAG: D-ribose pyranase [Bacteroidota bacterium]